MESSLTCDVLVIGAGPSGCAAARTLARGGLQVVLADRHRFPRDKVCGDGLISDTLDALDTLGIRDRVLEGAAHATELRLYAPSGRFMRLHGRFACLDRARLDERLLDAAVEAGAAFRSGLTALGPLEASGEVTGARFRTPGGELRIRARMTLLATGANTHVLDAFGLQVPLDTSAVAGRAYFEAPATVAAQFPHLSIAYDRCWCPGYGWVFPAPGGRFNIGVGLFPHGRSRRRLREFWQWFTTRVEPAAAIVQASRQMTGFRGAPLRTGLVPPRFGRAGLLAIGEAAAVTYPATGEGIGKSLESGLLAAHLVLEAFAGARAADTLHEAYGLAFRRRHLPRYRAYGVAQAWAGYPRLLDLLTMRANAGCFVRRELEALVDERGDPRTLFSARGLLTALVR